jgi:hypothetical protein
MKKMNIIFIVFIIFLIVFDFIFLAVSGLKKEDSLIINIIFLTVIICYFIFIINIRGKKTTLIDNRIDESKKNKDHDMLKETLSLLNSIILKIKNIENKKFDYKNGEIGESNYNEYFNEIKNVNILNELDKLTFAVLSMKNIVEIYHRIPYLIDLLSMIPQKTEEAALNLIDKFDIVHTENSKSNKAAQINIEKLKSGINGTDFQNLIIQSKEAVAKYDSLTNRFLEINSDNAKRLNKIGDWIEQITDILKNIEDFAEQNKIISINSSIEAARLGEKGKGFHVLALEIRKLNQKTSDFTKIINNIIVSFKEYNENLIMDWQDKTSDIINSIKDSSKNLEEIINILIDSYELTSHSFIDLTESTNKVDKSLNNIMESLQFQDITRQQVENVIRFLKEIQIMIKNNTKYYEYFNIDIDYNDKEIHNKIKDDLIGKVTVFEERKTIMGEFN